MTALGEVAVGDEGLVVYDPENYRAWIQSATAPTLVDRR